MNFNNLWVEKYRPKSLSDIVLVEETRSIVNSFKDKKEIPNLLLIGIQGIGKTSLAKIIVNDILGCQYLYINASDENGIDTIRNKVVSFSKTKSFDGGIKVIILDEVDGISLEAQKALRNTMEEYSSNTRFILTGNYKHKIIQALQSRCQELNPIPPLEGIAKRVLTILRSENIKLDDAQKKDLVTLIKKLYPDFRKIINEIQKFSSSGSLAIPQLSINNDIVVKITGFIKEKKSNIGRKYYIENEEKFQGDYTTLLRELFNFTNDVLDFNNEKAKKALLVISEHLYRSSFVVDQEINFYSCIIALEGLII
jgi:DNA polymerase III delta prime subunit